MSFSFLIIFLLGVLAFELTLCQVFDGKVRYVGDGKYEAYMRPPDKSNHASFLELVSSNSILTMAWFSGSGEGESNCSIYVSHMTLGTSQWSNATLVSRRTGYSNQNPVLFYDTLGSNKLVLFHSQQKAKKPGSHSSLEDTATVWTCYSTSAGFTWSEPVMFLSKPGSFIRNRIIESVMTSGLIFPIYYSESGIENQYSAILLSNPDRNNWTEHTINGSQYLIQPSVIRPAPEREVLSAYFRDKRSKYIYHSYSESEGYSWSPPTKTTLPNNDAAIQAYILASGNIAMVYNPTTGPRNPLRIAISKDAGSTWPYYRDLEYSSSTPLPSGSSSSSSGSSDSVEFSYPSMLQTNDGYIHVSYTYNRETIKYVKFKESWIYQKPPAI